MSDSKNFIDTNVLLYLLSSDTKKVVKVEKLLEDDTVISVQVLNEITNVARRKLQMHWDEVNEFLGIIQSICDVVPVSVETHQLGLSLAERYQFSCYDAMIVSSALLENCPILFSEDMQHQQVIEKQLRIVNPFSMDK